jgi:hypothetical protein
MIMKCNFQLLKNILHYLVRICQRIISDACSPGFFLLLGPHGAQGKERPSVFWLFCLKQHAQMILKKYTVY